MPRWGLDLEGLTGTESGGPTGAWYTVEDTRPIGVYKFDPVSATAPGVVDPDSDSGSGSRGVRGVKWYRCAITGTGVPEDRVVWSRGRWVAPWALDMPGHLEARDRTTAPPEPATVPSFGRDDWGI